MTLDQTYSLKEVAVAVGMSQRWVRDRCNLDNAEHVRMGCSCTSRALCRHKISFTREQVDKLRAGYVKAPVAESITTGRKRKSA